MTIRLFSLFGCLFTLVTATAQPHFKCTDGEVRFHSDAPLEIIDASSVQLTGLIDPANKTFVFIVEIRSFDGFNASLQREHFNENYMESAKYPHGTFKGKIIEDIDLTRPGTHSVRAKGLLQIHGVEQERIIKSDLVVSPGQVEATARFSVQLADHNIRIPKVVNEKIASEIEVSIHAILKDR